jgi:hypothetical protein
MGPRGRLVALITTGINAEDTSVPDFALKWLMTDLR